MPKTTISDWRVIEEMIISGADSRGLLCKNLSLSKASVTQAVNRLIKSGLISEGARFNHSELGRKTTRLSVKPDIAYFVGTDLEGTTVRSCVIDSNRRVIASTKRAIGPFLSKAKVARQWRQFVTETVESAKISPKKIVGLGVGLPGIVAKDGISTRTCMAGGRWIDFDISTEFSKLQYPVTASNNVICVSAYERRMGVAADADNFILLLVRYGIGVSMYSGGSLVAGEKVFIGELGHMRVDINGPMCTCTQKGCLDVFASGRTWNKDKFTSESSFHNDLKKRGFYLAVGLANLTKLYHPSLIVIDSIYNEYENIIKPAVEERFAKELSMLKLTVPKIVFGEPVERKTSIGAAIIAAEVFLQKYLVKNFFRHKSM